MKKKETKSPFYKHENHPAPVSRRDFMSICANGVIGGVLAPSFSSIFAQSAFAADCPAPTVAANLVPHLIIDLAGGANIMGGGVAVRGTNGAYLEGATGLGMAAGTFEAPLDYGIKIQKYSAFAKAFGHIISPQTKSKLFGMSIACISGDDTNSNPQNLSQSIAKANGVGSLLANAGTQTGASGGNSRLTIGAESGNLQPTLVRGFTDARNIVDPGQILTLLGPNKSRIIRRAIANMSEAHVKAFDRKTFPEQLAALVSCKITAAERLPDQVSSDALDPRNDPAIVGFLQGLAPLTDNGGVNAFINFNFNTQLVNQVVTLVHLLCNGYTNVATITLGGFDYHGQGKPTQNLKDLEAGTIGALALEIARLKGVPLTIQYITDGHCTAGAGAATDQIINNGMGPQAFASFTNDAGQSSGTVVVGVAVQDIASKPVLISGMTPEIGQYSQTGVHLAGSPTGNSVTKTQDAVLLNLLALSGREDKISEITGRSMTDAEKNNLLRLGRLF